MSYIITRGQTKLNLMKWLIMSRLSWIHAVGKVLTLQVIVVVNVLLFYFRGKQLWSCRDGQLT